MEDNDEQENLDKEKSTPEDLETDANDVEQIDGIGINIKDIDKDRVLSVEISSSVSSLPILSPTFFFHSRIVPSVIDSPIFGITTSNMHVTS